MYTYTTCIFKCKLNQFIYMDMSQIIKYIRIYIFFAMYLTNINERCTGRLMFTLSWRRVHRTRELSLLLLLLLRPALNKHWQLFEVDRGRGGCMPAKVNYRWQFQAELHNTAYEVCACESAWMRRWCRQVGVAEGGAAQGGGGGRNWRASGTSSHQYSSHPLSYTHPLTVSDGSVEWKM